MNGLTSLFLADIIITLLLENTNTLLMQKTIMTHEPYKHIQKQTYRIASRMHNNRYGVNKIQDTCTYKSFIDLKPRSHCPGSTPVCPGEGKPVYRHKPGNIFLKNDFVLTFPVLPRCSYGFRNEGPRWSHGSSRFYPGFIPVHAG